MAVHDDDCYCELPLTLGDEDLGQSRSQLDSTHRGPSTQDAPIKGFIAFSRLSRIAGSIQRLNSPRSLRNLATGDSTRKKHFMARVESLDIALKAWLESLPDDIRFSANSIERGRQGDRDLTMCVVIFIMHAGSLLNLYRLVPVFLVRYTNL
jgi:hypothetical protein